MDDGLTTVQLDKINCLRNNMRIGIWSGSSPINMHWLETIRSLRSTSQTSFDQQ